MTDCLTRFAGGGGGDDRPATLAGIPAPLPRPVSAIWRWGCGQRSAPAPRPSALVGSILLEHFYWGSVFLINVPIVLVVIAINAKVVPRQPARREQPLNLLQALVLIAAILMLVFSAKSALKGQLALWLTALVALGGAAMLTWFIRKQLSAARPMVDMRLFTHRIILSGVMMAMTALITLVGFELLMAQELQFVHPENAVRGGDIYAAGNGGQRLQRPDCRPAGVAAWAARGGDRRDAAQRLQLSRPGVDRFQYPAVAGLGLMTLLGFSVASALLASSSAIMAAAPKGKAAAAGAIETMAYELGAGLGIALFGLILTRSQRLYCAAVWPEWRHGAAGGVIDWRGGESVPGAARRGGAGADGGGEDGFYSGSPGAGDGGCIASAAGRRDLAQPRHRGEAAVGAIAAATGSIAARPWRGEPSLLTPRR